jgi:hypothetical protein
MNVTHAKVSSAGASSDPALVGGTDWNAGHVVTGGIQSVTVNLSSADILALGTTPKVLVAAPGTGKWLLPHKIVLALAFGTTAYTLGDAVPKVFSPGKDWAPVSGTLSAGATGTSVFTPADIDSAALGGAIEDQPIVLTSVDGSPTLGNGTLRVVVYYSVEDVP